ncbi:DUF493 domain-containing protein [Burkholderiaceae bacterium DAT-1]|nr:DUF493 domain-containing protein [Burkholderiaceae bacterium DAT-1]
MSESQDTLLEFPCRFPIKIMGAHHDEFTTTMLHVVRGHAPDVTELDVEMRASSGGRFLSVTITITAHSKPQLDNLYRELTAHPMVKVVL